MPRWKSEVRSDRGVFSELAEWWDAQPVPRGHPFLTSRVLGCWEDGFDEPGSRLNVLLLHRNGELVAGLPLYTAKGRLRSLARAYAEPFDVITIDDEEVTEYVPRWLESVPVASLYRVRSASPILTSLPQHPRWRVQTEFNSPYIDLSAGMGPVRDRMSSKYQRELRRRRRRIEEMGTLTFVERRTADGAMDLLQEGLRLEAAGWKGSRGHAVIRDPSHERWYRSLTEVALDQGWLRLSGLYLDERLVAFLYNLEVDGHRYGMATAFDDTPEVAPYSPGILLHESVFEACAAGGVTSYRLGVGNDSWKYEWATDRDQVYDLVLFGSGLMGWSAFQVWKVRTRARGRSIDRNHP